MVGTAAGQDFYFLAPGLYTSGYNRIIILIFCRQGELNQLHMQVDRLEKQRARETEKRQEELSKNQHNAAHHRRQLDELKR